MSNLGGSNYGLVNRTDPNLAARCHFSTRGVRAGSDEGLDRRASSLVPCLQLPRANRLGGEAGNEAIIHCASTETMRQVGTTKGEVLVIYVTAKLRVTEQCVHSEQCRALVIWSLPSSISLSNIMHVYTRWTRERHAMTRPIYNLVPRPQRLR